MARHLVIGAGLIGRGLARQLIDRGDDVTLVSRSGTSVDGATARAVEATDADALTSVATGSTTVFLTANPKDYHRWPELWPPMFAAAIETTRRASARLVMMGNLYAYGERAGMPMAERDRLAATETKGAVRQAGWELALAAHHRGEIQAAEVRASDYFGPGAEATAQLGRGFFAPLLSGKTARLFGSADQPHSWSYLPDITSTLVAAADHAGEWGRAWHVPSAEPLTRREIADRVDALTGSGGTVSPWPRWLLRAMALGSPLIRAANDSLYQFDRPFVIDSTETERMLGVRATPWAEALPPTIDWYREHPSR
ncbi:MAG: hypothetical protein RI885_2730 [Actinomycetota bacterium]